MKRDIKAVGHIINELVEMQSRLNLSKSYNIKDIECGSILLNNIKATEHYFNFIGAIVVIIDARQKVVFINKRGQDILGCSHSRCIDSNWFDNFIPERIRDDVKKCFKDLMAGKIKNVEYYENPVLNRSGEEITVAWHNTVLYDDKKQIVGTLSSGFEVTESRIAQTRLEELNRCFISFCAEPEKNINSLVGVCGKLMGASCALYNRLEDHFLYSAGRWNVSADFKLVSKAKGHICYNVIQEAKEDCILIRDLQKTAYVRSDPCVKKYGLQTYYGRAVKLGDTAVGSLCVVYQRDFIPDKKD